MSAHDVHGHGRSEGDHGGPDVADNLVAAALVATGRPNLPKGQGSTMLGGVVNLVNTVIGAGMLGLPYAFSRTGWLLGLLVMLGTVVLMNATMTIVLDAGTQSGLSTFEDVVCWVLNKRVARFSAAVVLVYLLGLCAVYLVIISDVTSSLLGGLSRDNVLRNEVFLVFFFAILVLTPLCLLRNIRSLRYTSLMAIVCVVYLMVLVFFLGVTGHDDDNQNVEVIEFSSGTILALPIFAFAFSCHMNLTPIQVELHDPTPRRITMLRRRSLLICGGIFSCVAFFGYLAYGSETDPNILQNFGGSTWYTSLGQVLYIVVIVFSYPLLAYACRLSADNLFFPDTPITRRRFLGWTALALVIPVVISVSVRNIAVLFDLIGSTCAAYVTIILPCAMKIAMNGGRYWSRRNVWYVLAVLFGSSMAVVGTVVTILELRAGEL